MSDMTNEQIEQEFARQVKLCSGLGRTKMLEILNKHFQWHDKLAEQATRVKPQES